MLVLAPAWKFHFREGRRRNDLAHIQTPPDLLIIIFGQLSFICFLGRAQREILRWIEANPLLPTNASMQLVLSRSFLSKVWRSSAHNLPCNQRQESRIHAAIFLQEDKGKRLSTGSYANRTWFVHLQGFFRFQRRAAFLSPPASVIHAMIEYQLDTFLASFSRINRLAYLRMSKYRADLLVLRASKRTSNGDKERPPPTSSF